MVQFTGARRFHVRVNIEAYYRASASQSAHLNNLERYHKYKYHLDAALAEDNCTQYVSIFSFIHLQTRRERKLV
jgi:hypothetical protein